MLELQSRRERTWRTTYHAGMPSSDRLLGFIWETETVTKLLMFPSSACASAFLQLCVINFDLACHYASNVTARPSHLEPKPRAGEQQYDGVGPLKGSELQPTTSTSDYFAVKFAGMRRSHPLATTAAQTALMTGPVGMSWKGVTDSARLFCCVGHRAEKCLHLW